MHYGQLTWLLVILCRQALAGRAFDDNVPLEGDPSGSFAVAALLIHLIRPGVFGMDVAAAACAALAKPLVIAATQSMPHNDRGICLAHQCMARAHVRLLRAALAVPGFPAAVAAEQPSALAVLAAEMWAPQSGIASCRVATIFAPAGYEVLSSKAIV